MNIENNFFDSMVNRIYPSELQLNKAKVSDTEASFLDLHLSISDGFVKTKIYDKRDDFGFDIVHLPFLDGDVPRSTSYGVYISQTKVSSQLGLSILKYPKGPNNFLCNCNCRILAAIHIIYEQIHTHHTCKFIIRVNTEHHEQY